MYVQSNAEMPAFDTLQLVNAETLIMHNNYKSLPKCNKHRPSKQSFIDDVNMLAFLLVQQEHAREYILKVVILRLI